MDCKACRTELPHCLESARASRRGAQVEAHLAACPTCAAELDALRQTVDLLRVATDATPPAGLWARIEADLDRPQPRWQPFPRLAWAGAVAVLAAVLFWPQGSDPFVSTAYLRDHYRVSAATPLGNPAMGDVLSALASEAQR